MLYAVMTVISAVGLLTGAVSACMAYRKGLGAICGISFLDAGTSFALGLPAMSYFFRDIRKKVTYTNLSTSILI